MRKRDIKRKRDLKDLKSIQKPFNIMKLLENETHDLCYKRIILHFK